MSERVVITGLGVVSSIGIGKDAFWNALSEGKSGISAVESIDTSQHVTHKGGEIKDFSPMNFMSESDMQSSSRATQFAIAASGLAIQDARLSPEETGSKKIGVCAGTTTGSMQVMEYVDDMLVKGETADKSLWYRLQTHTVSTSIARKFGFQGPNMMFSTACAAGNYGIGYGYDLIRLGKADLIIAGGSDPFTRISFTGFNQFAAVAPDKCQPFDKNRKGMIVAEGSGMLVLESLTSARGRRADIYAEVLGYGLSCDASHMTNPSIDGVAKCMRRAMECARVSREEIDYISAHGTGTPTNDRVECAAIGDVFGDRFKRIPVSSIKSMLGHTMGAASALEAITCVLAIKYDMFPPTINFETKDPECDVDCVPNYMREGKVHIALNNSYAFGGNNACLVLKKYIEEVSE